MSVYNCHKQQPQPWMSYIASNKPCYTGECCPVLLTNNEDTVEVFTPTNGFLYNGLVAIDARNVAPVGFHVPTQAEWQTLVTFLGGAAAAGGELKSIAGWDAPNVGASDSVGFTALPSGRRTDGGIFDAMGTHANFWSSTVNGSHSMTWIELTTNSAASFIANAWDIYGFSLRFIKDDAIDIGIVTGNNGIIYDTATIGTQVWTVQNSSETRYQDGSLIEEISNPTEWIGLFRPAMCKYNNNEDYAGVTAMACATRLLPFQVISNGAFSKMEYTIYGEDTWIEIVIPYSEVYIEGFYFITYNGSMLSVCLDCGAYEFRLTAGEVWYFETITIREFEDTENAYTIRDDLMLPFKFSEQQFETLPLIAQCDEIMPFMFSTENATSGIVTVYLYDVVNGCTVEELDIDVTVLIISGKTYYIFDGECIYPFLECGLYKLEIVDGDHSYFSVPFDAVCEMNDIPNGYRVMLDFNRCVMRDEDGVILYEECSDIPPPIIDVKYGLLYNWYAATDARNICSTGWHVPNNIDFGTLITYCGGAAIAGGKLKEAGFIYWFLNAIEGTNEFGFNLRGAGQREWLSGEFWDLKLISFLWSSTPSVNSYYCLTQNTINDLYLFEGFDPGNKNQGHGIRPIKDTTTLTHGQTGTYVGNDGKIYRTICIGTQEWLADNLCETRYRDGSIIPEVTGNAAWAALTTGALCAYNNDWSNV